MVLLGTASYQVYRIPDEFYGFQMFMIMIFKFSYHTSIAS